MSQPLSKNMVRNLLLFELMNNLQAKFTILFPICALFVGIFQLSSISAAMQPSCTSLFDGRQIQTNYATSEVQKKLAEYIEVRNHQLLAAKTRDDNNHWKFFGRDYRTIGELGSGDRGTVFLVLRNQSELVTHKSYRSKSQMQWELNWYQKFNSHFPENSLKVIDSINIPESEPAYEITKYIFSRPASIFFEYVAGVPDNVWPALLKAEIINSKDFLLLNEMKDELANQIESQKIKGLYLNSRHFGSFLFNVHTGKMMFVDAD